MWLCNIMLPSIAEKLGLPYSNREGWLTGTYERLNRENPGSGTGESGIELGICFPVEEMPAELAGTSGKLILPGTVCYAFREKLSAPEEYDAELEDTFRSILEDFRPDIVHIFGTEFPHSLAMVSAFARPERTLLGIQGLCFACAAFYMADIPEAVQRRVTFRDFVKKDSIRKQQEKFRIRGEREKETIRKTAHITGRTAFDRRETEKINPDAWYHPMNETMRAPFYSGNWSEEDCVAHTIFLSQGDYPLKGFHYMLKALPRIAEEYPDVRLTVAGSDITANVSLKDRIKISSYGKYLRELIKANHLEEKVVMTGRLSAEKMKEQFLRSSLYVCPSALENSPNSLCEAMLLGVPVLAADTGGIPSLLETETDGLLYQAGNVKELAEAVIRIWKEPGETKKRAEAARKRSMRVHDADVNYERLLEIYREMEA